MGDRWDRQAKWNLKEEDSDTGEAIKARLSVLDIKDDAVEVTLPYFGTEREEMLLKRMVPVKKIKTAAGERLVTTVYDLTMANYAIDRGLGGEAASSYEDDVPYTPHWQEKYTGISPELAIHTAREMADNSIKTDGRTMVIMGAGINHWYNADIIYRTILNLLLFIGAEGRNGGGWAHYVGQEKLRPAEGWARVMTATDWQPAARLQNSTSFFYFGTDQWRSDEIDTQEIVAATGKPRYRHPGDYNVLAARLGWLPSYPTFNKSGQKIIDEAKAAGHEDFEDVKKFVAESLKKGELNFSAEDPDAPENFPRNLFIWRANLITSSSKGHEYFLKYLLGTKNGLFAEEKCPTRPTESRWREEQERLQQDDAKKGFILDGFPRNTQQAVVLDSELESMGIKLDVALLVDVKPEVIINRLSLRRTCRDCGYTAAIGVDSCPRCDGEMYQRDDDRPETIARRLDTYQNQTAPLIEYYCGRKILKEVDGDRPVDEVYADVRSLLGL